jgi:hypothetical protein
MMWPGTYFLYRHEVMHRLFVTHDGQEPGSSLSGLNTLASVYAPLWLVEYARPLTHYAVCSVVPIDFGHSSATQLGCQRADGGMIKQLH